MLKTIEVVFDGKAFVPSGPVDLPAGTKACVSIPENPERTESIAKRPVTEAEKQEAERILSGNGTPLPWATVEEALAFSRGRPWPEPEGKP